MKNKIKETVLYIFVLVLVVIIVGLIVDRNKLQSTNDSRNVEIEKNIAVISQAKADSERAEKLIKELTVKNGEQAKLINAVKSSGKEIHAVGITKSAIKSNVERRSNKSVIHKVIKQKSDDTQDEVNIKNKLEYFFTKIYAKDSNDVNIPMAWAMFFPNEQESKQWRTGTYSIEFNHTIIETENEDGTFDRAVEVHVASGNNSESRDREHPIDIKDIKWEKFEISGKKMYWWNPRIGIGSMLYNKIAPSIDISLMSYGRTTVDIDWRFASFGLGYHKSKSLNLVNTTLTPISYNIGRKLPIIDNLFVGPQIIIEDFKDVNYGVGLSVPF